MVVILLLTGAAAVQAQGQGGTTSDPQLVAGLAAAERAYERIMELYSLQGSESQACHTYLLAARAALDGAAGTSEQEMARQQLQDAMNALRDAARCLEDVPESASALVAEQYRRIGAAYVRLQGASAMLGKLFGEMPLLEAQLQLVGESLEDARSYQESGHYVKMEQALQSAAVRIRGTQEALQEALREYRYGQMVEQYRSQLQESYQKTAAVIAKAQQQGIDVGTAQALLEQLRAGAETAAGHRQSGNIEAYRKALSDLSPVGEALRRELYDIVEQLKD